MFRFPVDVDDDIDDIDDDIDDIDDDIDVVVVDMCFLSGRFSCGEQVPS